jgi:hypothetical protein
MTSFISRYLWTLLALLPAAASGQGNIHVSASALTVNTLSISDVDFLNARSPKLLFTITVTNTTGRVIPAVLMMRIDALLSGGVPSHDGIVTLTTHAFPLGPVLTLTNLDIGRGKTLKDSLYEKDQSAISRIEQIALPSGNMPAGTYTFTVTVQELQGGSGDAGMFSIVLTNPTSVDLISPVDGDPSIASLPLFQWLFDGYRSRLSVYEKLPGQNSLEEAASGIPHLVTETAARSFSYPTAGARSLEPGKTYVWFVEGLVSTSGGSDIVLKSPLRSFTVASTGTPALGAFLDELERALDPKYRPLFDQIRTEGLSPSGTMRINGSLITTSELMRLISRLRANPGSVLTVTVDD